MSQRWLQVVAAGIFIDTTYGTLSYSFSVLVTNDAAGGDLGTAAVAGAFGLALLVSGVASLWVGTVADTVGCRWLMAVGSVVGAAGLALLSLCETSWQAMLVMALVVGPAMAATFYEPVYVLMNRWFPAHERPRAYGVLTLVSGVSITIFTPLTATLVESVGWRSAVLWLGLILFVVGTVVPLLVLKEPALQRKSRTTFASVSVDTLKGLRSGSARFWCFTAAFCAATAAFSGFSFHIVGLLEARGFDATEVARVIGIAGLVSLPTRLILPALAGRVRSLWLLCTCTAVLAGAALLASFADAWWQVWLYVVVFGAVFGAVYPLRALVTSEHFDAHFFGRLLGAQALFVAVGRAAGPAVVGGLADGVEAYSAAFRVCAVVLVLATVALAISLRGTKPAAGQVDAGNALSEGSVGS